MSELRFREAVLDDAAPAADLATAARPDEPVDPEVQRWWWSHPDRDEVVRRVAVERDGRLAGVITISHTPWERVERRYASLSVKLGPEAAGARAAAYGHAEGLARADGAEVLVARAGEREADRLALLESRGYVRRRIERVWELDLRAHGERLLAEAGAARRKLREQGLRAGTMEAERDPELRRRLHELISEGESDIPTTMPFVAPSFESAMQWLEAPNVRPERTWIARDGERVVGLSLLGFPPVRGHVRTEFTAVARSHRGRGVARALKLETLAQAIELGVPSVRTDNDGENAPILHLNEQLGYRPLPGVLELHRPA